MTDEQPTPAEQSVIQQLQSLPKPRLDPHTREVLREHMLAEFRDLPLTAQPLPSRFSVPAIAAAAAILVILIGLGVILSGLPPAIDTTLTTSPSTQVAVITSATPEPHMTFTPTTAAFTATPITPTPTSVQLSATQPSTTSTPTPTATLETLIVVEGNITNILNNTLQIYDLNIEVEPQHPILNLVDVGDFVRVEGTLDTSGNILASVVGNVEETSLVDSGITVSLEGLVESINDSSLVVNGIPVQLDPGDPLLQTLQVGNFINVQGNFEGSGDTIVLVVVNITIINYTPIQNDPNCWQHDGMGMGHWHCDGMGMGMGMGDEGMGMGEAMGMGN